ncbi:cbb3-type cytochrome c oxidase subunit I [Flavisolibacter ginsengisoli]|jgi:cytochrome c oxidase subunit 1|uniref:Cytochrome c oxidase subunit 1 n=1 Tax=Flavisolibacter ginsengisoli DSM 18119 TaxID=1121884 RepID=A0A1M4W896_9BACT|nr:cbb3-type cytochrome c oxidase subunit I [Flavisolibacter ginsengisoli]SHE77484.1 cytochrome c oxidase subunit 1 [Flavisolibacter ginsengisoli DSM 18119]
MQLSKSLRRVIYWELGIPLALLSIGIYHGLMQVIYRAGVLQQPSFAKLDYYQGLTLHGVINAIVLTTFFAVAFGHATIAFFLKKEPNKKLAWLSFWLMTIGTLMAAWAMLAGKASVLYTFYPPLKAHPFFYLGTALLIVGSWIPLFDWSRLYRQWRKENPDTKTPLAVLGTLVNFIIWFVCTLAAAYEVLVLLLPWAMGWKQTVNVTLARTLFWFFGHALVYFWLLPAYIMFYNFLPKLAGGKLFSDLAGRIALFGFLLFSVPVGVHHQFSDPSITKGVKIFQSLLTFGVAIPSFITAFTLAASLEYAGRKRGAKGLLGFFGKLPYLDQNRYLFAYMISGLFLFIFGGLTGIVNSSSELNAVVHNTAWLPGHFHMTVAGPVFLAIIGMSLYIYSKNSGKKVFMPKVAVIIPYLWVIGILIFSTGLSWGGLLGEPRRTNLGMTYLNPKNELFTPEWVPTTTLALLGGIIMFIAGMLFLVVFFGTMLKKQTEAAMLEFPVSENLHNERRIPLFDSFKPWLVTMAVVLVIAYVPAFLDATKNPGPGAPRFTPDNPVPVSTTLKTDALQTPALGDKTASAATVNK